MLGDGKWHMLDEIRQKTKVDKDRIQQTVEFLKEYNFIVVDEDETKVKLNEMARKFLTQTATA